MQLLMIGSNPIGIKNTINLSCENIPSIFRNTMRIYNEADVMSVKNNADLKIIIRSSELLSSEHNFNVEVLNPIPPIMEKILK